jgi:hypothetical protein
VSLQSSSKTHAGEIAAEATQMASLQSSSKAQVIEVTSMQI